MAENMERIWSINDLMKRYGINRASMTEYAKAKIDIINKDDIHAKKAGKEWQFDAEAVRILDELRGYGVAVENYDSPEKAEIAELKRELEEARKFMAAAQTENSRQKDKIIELLETKDKLLVERGETTKLLADFEANRKIAEDEKQRLLEMNSKAEAELQAKENRLAVAENGRVEAEVRNEILQKELESTKSELESTKSELTKEKNKSFWERWFG